MDDLWLLVLAFGISLALGGISILSPDWVFNQEHMRLDIAAKQAQHTRPTPRVGGAAVVVSLLIVGILATKQLQLDLILALLPGLLVFVVGLREDIRRDVSPKVRLIAAFAAGALAVSLTGQTVHGLGLVHLDRIFGWFGLGVIVTLLWSAGSCHALNLIDGLNGLASGYAICAAAAFWVIGGYTQDTDIQTIALLLISALLGFFVLNWPLGLIFLGDAGAYVIGHVLAWLGILLIARNPEVVGFAVLLVMFWPVADTIFSIIRRVRLRKATDQPDRLHFHHLVVRGLALAKPSGKSKVWGNSLATIVMMPLFIAPILGGVVFWDEPIRAFLVLGLFAGVFIITYRYSIDYFVGNEFRQRANTNAPNYYEEVSKLSGIYVQDGMAVDVHIFRSGPELPWELITYAAGAHDRRWEELFDTDLDAWETFLCSAQQDGMQAIMGRVL